MTASPSLPTTAAAAASRTRDRRRPPAALAAAVLAVLLVLGPLGASPAQAVPEVQCFDFMGHTVCWIIPSEKQPEIGPDPACLSCPSLAIGVEELIRPELSSRLGQKALPAVQAVLGDVAVLQRTTDARTAKLLHADIAEQVASLGAVLGAADGHVVARGSKTDAAAAGVLTKALAAAQAGHIAESVEAFGATASALQR